MNEYNTLIQWGIVALSLAISSILYAWGGIQKKWLRRFLGSSVLVGSVTAVLIMRHIWEPLFLIVFPLQGLAWSLPYGADSLFPKIVKRAIFASASVACGIVFCIKFGGNAWFVLIPHAGVALWSVYMGVKNPIESVAEQGAICFMLSLGLIMYPFSTGF